MNLQVAHKALHRDKAVTEKSSSTDMVTETDREVEKLIVSTLKQKFPAHRWVSETKCVSLFRSIISTTVFIQLVWHPLSFIGEESTSEVGGHELTDDPTWMIDPIDGTTNFVHRSLALNLSFLASFPGPAQLSVAIGTAFPYCK